VVVINGGSSNSSSSGTTTPLAITTTTTHPARKDMGVKTVMMIVTMRRISFILSSRAVFAVSMRL